MKFNITNAASTQNLLHGMHWNLTSTQSPLTSFVHFSQNLPPPFPRPLSVRTFPPFPRPKSGIIFGSLLPYQVCSFQLESPLCYPTEKKISFCLKSESSENTPYNLIEHSTGYVTSAINGEMGYLELSLLYMERRFKHIQLFEDIFNSFLS